MKAAGRNLLGVFLVVSLAVHLGAYRLFKATPTPRGSKPVSVMLVEPAPVGMPADPESISESHTQAGQQAQTERYRPTEGQAEGQQDSSSAKAQASSETTPEKTASSDTRIQKADNAGGADGAPSKPMSDEEFRAYREALLRDFDPDWTAIPDLVVRADPETQREVSRFFGMKLIAYPKGQEHPSYVVVIDEESGGFEYTREFDFTKYSNRAKDRSNLPEYAGLARRIKSRLGLPEELAVVSIVPAAVDRYFAAEQCAAVARAGLKLQDVRETQGRYVKQHGGYRLVIEKVR